MKKLIIALAAIALSLSSCSEDSTTDNAMNDSIDASLKTILAPEAGGTEVVTITSSGDWRIAGVCDWARPSAVAGKSGDKVTFTIDANTTDTSREATFKVFTGAAVVPIKVTSAAGSVLELVSESNLILTRSKNSIILKLNTNIPELTYTFTNEGSKWITFEERSMGLGGVVLLRFSVAENTDYSPRATEMTIAGLDASIPVKISQQQVDAIIVAKEQLDWYFDLTEQTFTINVQANVPYTVSPQQTWIEQITTRALEPTTLKFKITAVPAGTNARGGKITLRGTGVEDVVISVIQKDPSIQTVKFPDDAFRSKLVEFGWIMNLAGAECVVLDAGLNATELNYTRTYYDAKTKSIEGVENFPNLTKISVSNKQLTSVDISKLKKVKTLIINGQPIRDVKLGDNPITTLDLPKLAMYDDDWNEVATEVFTISSTNLESLNLNPSSTWDLDILNTIDVSACPKLKTLKAQRKTGVLKKIILKTGQTIENLTYTAGAVIEYK